MEYDNIDRLKQLRQQERRVEQTAEPETYSEVSDAMADFAEHQVYANLKATNKPVSQMSDQEKLIFAKFEQEFIEYYEMTESKTRFEYEKFGRYSGSDVDFSPLASIVLDEFFTDGKN